MKLQNYSYLHIVHTVDTIIDFNCQLEKFSEHCPLWSTKGGKVDEIILKLPTPIDRVFSYRNPYYSRFSVSHILYIYLISRYY